MFYNCRWSRKKVIEKVLRVFWSDDGKLYFYFVFEEMSIELYLILKSLFTLEQSPIRVGSVKVFFLFFPAEIQSFCKGVVLLFWLVSDGCNMAQSKILNWLSTVLYVYLWWFKWCENNLTTLFDSIRFQLIYSFRFINELFLS